MLYLSPTVTQSLQANTLSGVEVGLAQTAAEVLAQAQVLVAYPVFWLLVIVLTLAVAGLLRWLFRRSALQQQAVVKQLAFEEGLQHQAHTHAEELKTLAEQIEAAKAVGQQELQAHAVTQARLEAQTDRVEQLGHQLEEKNTLLSDALRDLAANTARMEEAQKGFGEKEQLFRESTELMKKEFELLASKVFDAQGEKHQASLQTVLTPFREQITDFKKKVEEVYLTDTRERASLLSEVRNLQAASERINTEAENLTRALKGDKKLQGNWGELVLERVLEESGLRKDHEYFVQVTSRDDSGSLKRPDVLIRLPEEKDVVIDAKVSLNAYEEALSSEEDAAREVFMKQHIANLRSHVKRLSEQNYDQLPDVRSLDFVLMFIPIESAFTMALEFDTRLFSEAFAKRIVIVSPTTLMMTLRIINNVWRYEKQNRNAQVIAARAGALYDKLRLLVEDMEKLGKQLDTADKTYQTVFGRLTTGKGNLVSQAEKFRELGAQVKQPIAAHLIEKADPDGTSADDQDTVQADLLVHPSNPSDS